MPLPRPYKIQLIGLVSPSQSRMDQINSACSPSPKSVRARFHQGMSESFLLGIVPHWKGATDTGGGNRGTKPVILGPPAVANGPNWPLANWNPAAHLLGC